MRIEGSSVLYLLGILHELTLVFIPALLELSYFPFTNIFKYRAWMPLGSSLVWEESASEFPVKIFVLPSDTSTIDA